MRPSVRFDVFKRDDFTCIYCIKGKQADREGRRKTCTVCGRWLILGPDQDTSLEYHHTSCEKDDG